MGLRSFPLEQGRFRKRRVRQHPLCAGFLRNRIVASRPWRGLRSLPNLWEIPRALHGRHLVPGSRRGLTGHARDGTGRQAGARRRAPSAQARGFIAASGGRLLFPGQLLRVYVRTYCGVVERARADDPTSPLPHVQTEGYKLGGRGRRTLFSLAPSCPFALAPLFATDALWRPRKA